MAGKWVIISIIFLTIVNLSALGTFIYYRWYSTDNSCLMKKPGDHGCYMREHLNISEEQSTKLNAIEQTYKPITDSIAFRMKENRIMLVEELMKDNTDSNRVESILNSVDSLQARIQREIVKRLLHEKGILTPQQQKKFFSLVLNQFCMEMDSIKQTQCQKQNSLLKGETPQ